MDQIDVDRLSRKKLFLSQFKEYAGDDYICFLYEEAHIKELLQSHEYVEFLVGRDGEFDQAVASTVRRMKRVVGDCNSSLIWVLPYLTAEYENNVTIQSRHPVGT